MSCRSHFLPPSYCHCSRTLPTVGTKSSQQIPFDFDKSLHADAPSPMISIRHTRTNITPTPSVFPPSGVDGWSVFWFTTHDRSYRPRFVRPILFFPRWWWRGSQTHKPEAIARGKIQNGERERDWLRPKQEIRSEGRSCAVFMTVVP